LQVPFLFVNIVAKQLFIALLGLLVAIAEFVFIVCKHIFETKKK